MTSDAVALSDLTFFSKIRFFAGFLLKTVVLFSIFIILIPLKQMLCFFSGEFNSNGLLFFAIIILGYCIVYDIFFIISEGIIKEMVKGMVISLIGGVLAVFFPPFFYVITYFQIHITNIDSHPLVIYNLVGNRICWRCSYDFKCDSK